MQICRGPIVGSTLSMCLITFECISQSGPICKLKRPNKRNHSECKEKRKTVIGSVQICQYPHQTVYPPISTHNCKYKKIDELDFSFAVFCFALLLQTATFDNICSIYLRTNRIKYRDVDSKLPYVPSYNLANKYNPWKNVTVLHCTVHTSQYRTLLSMQFHFLRFSLSHGLFFPHFCENVWNKMLKCIKINHDFSIFYQTKHIFYVSTKRKIYLDFSIDMLNL